MTFILLLVSLSNDLANPVFDDLGRVGFLEQGQCFFSDISFSIPTIVFYYFSLSLFSVYRLELWRCGLRADRVFITLSLPCTADFFDNNNNKNNNNNNNNDALDVSLLIYS